MPDRRRLYDQYNRRSTAEQLQVQNNHRTTGLTPFSLQATQCGTWSVQAVQPDGRLPFHRPLDRHTAAVGCPAAASMNMPGRVHPKLAMVPASSS